MQPHMHVHTFTWMPPRKHNHVFIYANAYAHICILIITYSPKHIHSQSLTHTFSHAPLTQSWGLPVFLWASLSVQKKSRGSTLSLGVCDGISRGLSTNMGPPQASVWRLPFVATISCSSPQAAAVWMQTKT